MSPSEEATEAAERAWRGVDGLIQTAGPTTEVAWKAGYMKGYDDACRNPIMDGGTDG